MNAPARHATAPILIAAEKYVAEFESCNRDRRERMEKAHPGRYAAAVGVIQAWSKPDRGQSESPDARAAHVAAVIEKYRPKPA